ncbi:biotin transporter BioY [Pelagibius sp. 7325]|uniref:biotin transporter BioY n=1 Tax=Pelagibius sp. 7325 TaxID=3131994 RepID=UPI0030ECC243
MTDTAVRHDTLAAALWPSHGKLAEMNGLARASLLALVGSLLLYASAKVQVPFYPVPITMQTFAVLVIGMAYGWRLGGATVAFYLAQGAVGLPVFAGTPEKGLGLAYMAGPTGGYLLGFLLAAIAVGWLAERGWDRSVLKTLAAMVLGTAIIFALGVLYLGALIGWDKPVLDFGLYPFLPGAVFKIGLAAAVLPLAWKAVSKRG